MEISTSLILLAVLVSGAVGQFEWQPRDAFDEVRHRIDKVNRSLHARAWFFNFHT